MLYILQQRIMMIPRSDNIGNAYAFHTFTYINVYVAIAAMKTMVLCTRAMFEGTYFESIQFGDLDPQSATYMMYPMPRDPLA